MKNKSYFAVIEMNHVTIHCFVFLDWFGNLVHHLRVLSVIPSVHDRFPQPAVVTPREIIHHLLDCICQFIALWFYLFKDYSFSHGLSAFSFLCHNGQSHVGRYLVTASDCLSVRPSVRLSRHIVVSRATKEQYVIESLFLSHRLYK